MGKRTQRCAFSAWFSVDHRFLCMGVLRSLSDGPASTLQQSQEDNDHNSPHHFSQRW